MGGTVSWAKRVKWSYYQNVVDSSYSFVWWGWDRWQIELDWMALRGINLALMYTGQEKVLLQLYQLFGIDLSRATGSGAAFFDGPAFLSWSRGQGMSDVGGLDAFLANGTTGALPAWWYEQQAQLGKQIMARMADLGVTAILRGFEGNVPLQMIDKFPTANISKAGLLDALDPLFDKLSDAYMKLLIAEFGTAHFYQADGLFSNINGPWMAGRAGPHDPPAPCGFTGPFPDTFVAVCAGGGFACPKLKTLAEAEVACSADVRCGGITQQYGGYSLRRGNATLPSPSNKPSTSWLLSNRTACHNRPKPPAPPHPKPGPHPHPSPPGPIEPDPTAAAHSAAAFAGLTRTDPEATWVYQTWIWRGYTEKNLPYLKGWIGAVPTGRLLLLDQTAEWTPLWSKFHDYSFFGAPFIWCAMSSMGGTLGMYGDVAFTAGAIQDALGTPGSSVVGTGIDPEGIDNNPMYYSLVFDAAWSSAGEPFSVSEFVAHWADQRCERRAASALAAWTALMDTVYKDSGEQVYEHHMKYCPSTAPDGSGWDKPTTVNAYDNATELHAAWGLMIDAAADCNASAPGFIFDLVDVGREFLSLAPCLAALAGLSTATTGAELAAANSSMYALLTDLDELLASSDGFLLGTWLADARALAADAGHVEHADFLEWNARAQVTSWAPVLAHDCNGSTGELSSNLYDYANKEWAGLVAGFHRERYTIFAEHRAAALAAGGSFDKAAYQGALTAQACAFQHRLGGPALQAAAVGDAVAISRELWRKYAPSEHGSVW